MMAWPEITIQSWGDFDAKAQHVWPSPETRRFFFRGQAKSSWGLRCSLARMLPRGSMTVEEIDALQLRNIHAFIENLNSIKHDDRTFLSTPPKSAAQWLGLMQHYRVPTTLLDWSFSPYIAAYFAVASFDHWDSDGAVWFFHESFVETQLNMQMYMKATTNRTPLDQSLMQYSSIQEAYPESRIKLSLGSLLGTRISIRITMY
jgi:hypothetical protein